jgi:hypothetical protein
LNRQGGESELKKPRVGVQRRVNDNNLKRQNKPLREIVSMRVIPALSAMFPSLKKKPVLFYAAQIAPHLSTMKVAFMASIPSIALRR